MQRITLALTDETAELFERLIRERGYSNRSEAFRDILRQIDADEKIARGEGECAAVVSYVYNHHERRLAARMTERQHEHPEIVHSVMHVHLNHEECLEAMVLFGPMHEVRDVADGILSEPGVRNGSINAVPLSESEGHGHSHTHSFGHEHDHDRDHEHGHDHEHESADEKSPKKSKAS